MINTSIDKKVIDLQKIKDQTSAEQKRDRQRLNNLLQKLQPGEWYSHCMGNGCIYVYGYDWQVGYYGLKPLSQELIPYNISSGYSPKEAQKMRASYR